MSDSFIEGKWQERHPDWDARTGWRTGGFTLRRCAAVVGGEGVQNRIEVCPDRWSPNHYWAAREEARLAAIIKNATDLLDAVNEFLARQGTETGYDDALARMRAVVLKSEGQP